MASLRHLGLIGLCLVLVSACERNSESGSERPVRAGQSPDPLKTAAQIASVHAAAVSGDQEGVETSMRSLQRDHLRSMKLADPSRKVDRESARSAARQVEGVRSVAWVDRENLFVIVNANSARTYETIDRICLALEPLGDTLGVVVNLQSGAAQTGDELEILSRNCQLEPGDRAMLSRNRQLNTLDPEMRRQHRANQSLADQDAEAQARQAKSLRILEASTPSVDE